MNQSCLQLPQTTTRPAKKALSISLETLGLSKIQTDLFICTVQTVSKCFSKQTRLPFWKYLKKRLKQLNLRLPQDSNSSCLFRNKANCLQVCCSRLIIEDYPDAVRYRPTTPEVIVRIIREHLLGNNVVEEYAFLTHPLPESSQVCREKLIEA
ncbi:ferredoxin-like protein [Scytonema sp. HK-05]|uniref:(2Fe-2S) ferredoxin domain-containing protein n=1 Tax=Scytonema sp. HK-05 TaxID=1137095 RepID=UPI000936062A|nr:ferredoxin [Scytonema sp. HK-05]BAY43660.1 ferredoxin-like protein [Scytonema sp. HK-05]